MPPSIPTITWPATAADAIALQKEMQGQVRLENDSALLTRIAGVDVSYDLEKNTSRAVIVCMTVADLAPLETVVVDAPTTFPYVPGLLSFREIPVVLEALKQVTTPYDVLMVDGQGVAHPRRLGIASHLGVLLDMPALGVAKSRLTGTYKEPGNAPGDHALLMDKGQRIGSVLRSKKNTNLLFVSPGHRMDADAALALTLQCLRGYRLPEPTRIADKISKQRGDKAAPMLAGF